MILRSENFDRCLHLTQCTTEVSYCGMHILLCVALAYGSSLAHPRIDYHPIQGFVDAFEVSFKGMKNLKNSFRLCDI